MINKLLRFLFEKKDIDFEENIHIPAYIEDIKTNNVKEIKKCLEFNSFDIEDVY